MIHITIIMITFPRVGLGTMPSAKDQVKEAVRFAIEEAGYRNIDCASAYFNEAEVGEALKDLLTRKVVRREEIWVTSKLWNTDHSPSDVESACRKTLKDLQLDYLDLYLMHWPCAFKKVPGDPFPKDKDGKMLVDESISMVDTWKAMEKLVSVGLVRHIGVANFTIECLEKLRLAPGVTMKPYTNQVDCHLYNQQNALINYCSPKNIIVTCHTPLGSPKFVPPGTPKVLEDEVLVSISKELNKTPAQVELRFLLELGSNVVVIPKSVTPERIRANNELNFDLTQDQVNRLKSRDLALRYYNFKKMWGIDIHSDTW